MKSYTPAKLLLTIIFSAVMLLPRSMYSQPSHIHLSLQLEVRPGVTAPITVTWFSDSENSKQYVKYGTDSDPRKKIKAVMDDYNGISLLRADIRKLKPGRKYYYKCGSDKTGWSKLYTFTSEPDTGTFRVAVIGDTQDTRTNQGFTISSKMTDLVIPYSPVLTLHMGDIVETGSVKSSWSEFLSVTQELNAISPLMPVLGNHDVHTSPGEDFQEPFEDFYSLFNLPGDEINYSFTYANTRFIGVFSGYAQAAEKSGQVKYKPGSTEYKWLDNELENAENDPDVGWIIVWMHYPVNSSGWSNVTAWRENVLPLIEKHKVNLCLSGHKHVYERHFQMRNGEPVKKGAGEPFAAVEGTIFITNGSLGGNPTTPGGNNNSSIAFTPEKPMYNFAIMDIGENRLTYSVYDLESNLIDRFTMVK